ncbi:MAG: ABC transporter permease [Alphaproteobacteria bacterium]
MSDRTAPHRGPIVSFSLRRVSALILRYVYLLMGSWPRLLELAYWPSVQIILWGFISKYFVSQTSWAGSAAGALLAAVLLWDILFRGQLGYTISFMEEMWSRNLGQLFISPLRPYEMVLSLTAISLIRTLVGVIPAAVLAIPLYGFSLFDLGLPLIAFFGNLMVTGWALGLLVTALLLRVGLGAESVAWMALFLIAPVSAIYYPVDVLPAWLQAVAWSLPPAYVFEGMRAILFDGVFRGDLLIGAVLLNLLYLVLGGLTFTLSFRLARRQGLLHQLGE